jgi:hypothetical protein
MAEIARELVDKGMIAPQDEDATAAIIDAKLKELETRKRDFEKGMDINTEPLIP